MSISSYIQCLSILLLCSCSTASEQEVDDVIIASVYNTNLYQSDMQSIYDSDISQEEKDLIIKAYVSNWIRDQLMIKEAEKYVPDDVNIDLLVKEYRASLILNHYENKIVDDLLDTIVSKEQKQDYYQQYKEEFRLAQGIIKGIAIKIDKAAVNRKLIKALDNLDSTVLQTYFNKADYAWNSRQRWVSVDDMLKTFPDLELKVSDVENPKKLYRKRKGNFEYFVKTVDFVHKNEVPPLNYIEPKLTQIILNNRKQDLLKRKKQQLYDKNYSNSNIKINI